MKKLYALLIFSAFVFTARAQTTVVGAGVNNGDFESGTPAPWNVVNNGTASNGKWTIGTNSICNGTKSAYVTTNNTGNNNSYNLTFATVIHLYMDVTFPAGSPYITFSFNFKGGGETNKDFMKVYSVSTATTPVGGTQLPAGNLIAGPYLLNATCTNYSMTLPAAYAGTTQRIVFSWINDASGGAQPGATLDDVTIISYSAPNCATLTSPTNGATGLCTSGTTLNWTAAATGGPPTAYLLYFGTNAAATNINNGTNIGNVLTYSPGTLLANTTYYWYVVPTNPAGTATGCTIYSFTTGGACLVQTPGGNFSACSGSFYDSGGPTNTYTNNENSVTTICPSTAGQYLCVSFNSFNLESCCDYLRIYNGNSTASPLIGQYTGTSAPCNVTSTSLDGCLTFEFHSDISIVYSGWDATLSCVAVAPPAPAGATCATAPAISLPYTATGQTTVCYGNDYSNASIGSCGTLYESGEDRVYALTVAAPQCISITLSNASTTSIGYQVYSGCPGSAGTTCIGSNGGSNPLSGSVVLPAAGTYYIIVDTWASPNNCTYDIAISSLGTGPPNDLPCSASSLALNTNLTGDNSCTGSASEPGVPTCWTTGNLNTVWYTVTAPASGQLKVRTTLGTLTNTQIALYSGTCGSLTEVACNDNSPACGSSFYNNSEISATGLTPGATYYIRVDGTNNLTGTFDIMAVDATAGFPAAAGQDCSAPNPVCNMSTPVGNPGYQAYGNICDFPGGGTNCLASGERGSAWYTIPINANGTLQFDIVPNDWTGGSGCCSTDYDFAVWKIAGSGATTCAGIAAGATPISCNYSGLGVTGCFSNANGTSPAAYPGYGGAYMAQINVSAGDVYVLCVSNFSNSTSGFTLNINASSPVNYTASSNSVNWSGGANTTNWNTPANWGGCSAPVCGIDATITPSSSYQPVLVAGTYYVNNLTINAGASLTLQAGAILHICGNFTNFGSIVASPTSTVIFDNAATNQSLTGSFVGADKLGNLTVTKTGGAVTLNNNIDLGGTLTTSNGTSVLNLNGKYVKVAGDFLNNNGSTTMTNMAGSTVEFNGTGAQNYNQGASTLTLNNVVMNHSGPGVTCVTNMVLGTSGVLTLTQGKLTTNANEVQVTNTASAAVTTGNTSSYVNGNLRRYLNGAATSYDFPVGNAAAYQRANITFTTATTIPQLVARFDAWGTVPVGPAASECPNATYNVLQALNNGYWTITASANPTSGTYNTTLYSTNYTNSASASGWTVMKATTGSGPWGLNGTCVATSTASNTQRTGMNGFSAFAVAQTTTPLPVELLDFNGTAEADFNHIFWSTASENSNAYFTLERSADGINFQEIARVPGAGTTSQHHDYYFNDVNPTEGTNYYRLQQTDYNGHTTASTIISLDFHRGFMSVANLRPNPTSGEVNFDFASPEETDIHYTITDVTGRVIVDEHRHVKAGVTTIESGIADESAGVYTLKVIEEKHGFISVNRIVKY